MEAWYGEPESQGFISGDKKGYEHAYYYGKTSNISIIEGKTTDVEVNASIQNSVIVIEYADAFKNYFTDWSTTVQTDGNVPVELGGAEGMAYVTSGNVSITISAELQNGKTIRLNPGGFMMLPQHMYKLRYNIYNGEIGSSDKLAIEFDDSLQEDPITIDLSEDLGNTQPPVLITEGFENGKRFDTQSGTPLNGEIKFNVMASGGIAEAKLTVVSEAYKPAFLTNGVVDLCKITKEELETAGIKAVGFTKPGEMALLDLTELCEKLPDGEHKFIFQVKDGSGQVNEPIEVTVLCIPVKMSMTADPAPFGEGYADITVSYNGPEPTIDGPFIFRSQGNYSFEDSKILSVTKKQSTKAFESHDYIFRISIPDVDLDVFKVRSYFNQMKEQPDMETEVAFVYPDYKVQLDPMTRKLRINVVNDDPKKKTLFFHKLKVFIDDKRLDEGEGEFSRDEPTGLIAVYKLQPKTQYRVRTTLQSAEDATIFGSDDTFTTSPATEVPNGDFSQTAETINKTLRVGGEWLCGAITYKTECLIKYSEPTGGWCSINNKTFGSGSPDNTWFKVASTYLYGGAAVIRTVGFSQNGTVPDKTGEFFSTTHYNTKAPDYNSFTRCSGELFLGTYQYNGKDERTEGYDFSERPTSFTFNYKYEPQQLVSRGSAEIIVYAEDGSTIINHRKVYLTEATTMTEKTIVLHRYPFGVKAGKICIKFLSSDLEDGYEIEVKHPTGDALDEGVKNLPGWKPYTSTIGENSAHALCVGSVLTVSNLRFVYGEKQND